MKPFQLPAWRKKQINSKYARKSKVINFAVARMEEVMERAVDEIMRGYDRSGDFHPPTLNAMFGVSDQFYRKVVEQAFYASEDEKSMQRNKKRLARRPPMGIPRSMRDLEKFFRNNKAWPKVLKRSKMLTERLRKQYIEKLRKKFTKIAPMLKSGEITPAEAKSQMMDTWRASKSRVETIFRTETTNYFGKTQVAFFEGDPEIIGFLFDSVRDVARTDICRSRHGLVYRPGTKLLTENTPALHYNCRSHLIALANTPHNRKMLEDPDRDPSNRKVAPLPPGWRK